MLMPLPLKKKNKQWKLLVKRVFHCPVIEALTTETLNLGEEEDELFAILESIL